MTKHEYVGKICPYCKTEFREDDDIVICSVCEMPHHKDCWVENQGCTTFGCMGTIKPIGDGPTSVTTTEIKYDEPTPNSFIYCTKCGAPNQKGNSFCGKCGNQLASQAYQTNTVAPSSTYQYQQYQNTYNQLGSQTYGQNTSNDYLGQDSLGLIGSNSTYYADKFKKISESGNKSSWNWCAFLFAPYWMIYRKMYGYGFAILAVALIISLIGNWFVSLLAFGGYIAFGILGNSIYMSHIDKLLSQVKNFNDPYKTQYISQKGGTNTVATVFAVIGYAVLVTLITYS